MVDDDNPKDRADTDSLPDPPDTSSTGPQNRAAAQRLKESMNRLRQRSFTAAEKTKNRLAESLRQQSQRYREYRAQQPDVIDTSAQFLKQQQAAMKERWQQYQDKREQAAAENPNPIEGKESYHQMEERWDRERNPYPWKFPILFAILKDLLDVVLFALTFLGIGLLAEPFDLILDFLLLAFTMYKIPKHPLFPCLIVVAGFILEIFPIIDVGPFFTFAIFLARKWMLSRFDAPTRQPSSGDRNKENFTFRVLCKELWETVGPFLIILALIPLGIYLTLGPWITGGIAVLFLLFFLWKRFRNQIPGTEFGKFHLLLNFIAILAIGTLFSYFFFPPIFWALVIFDAVVAGLMLLLRRSLPQQTPGQQINVNVDNAQHLGKGKIFFSFLLILLLLLALLIYPPGPLGETGPFATGSLILKGFALKNPDSPMAKTMRGAERGLEWFFNTAVNLFTWSDRYIERQLAYASGDFYTGQVDENAKKELGVFLEDIQPSSREFEDTESVVVWGTLSVLTLDENQSVNVELACFIDEKEGPKGTMDPDFIPKLINLDRQDLTCTFDPGTISEGSEPVHLTARFNFKTEGYLKAYFMDKDRMQGLQRGGKDPLTFYQVPDPNPVAIYTHGPVGIGMDTLEPLIGLSGQQETKFRLGITLENAWDGKIKQVHDVTIKIPPMMELVDCAANKDFKKVKCEGEECEPDPTTKQNRYEYVYKLLPTAAQKIKEVDNYESFSCRVQIDNNAKNAVMGNVPLATHYFKASATYTYEVQESTVITVKPSTGFNVYFKPSQEAPLRNDNGKDTVVLCSGKHSDVDIISVDYQFFRQPKDELEQYPLSEGSTVCKNEDCSVEYVIHDPELKEGDLLICNMKNPNLEKESPQLSFQCSLECESYDDPSEYNQCKKDCQQSLAYEEFSAVDTLRIVNSKPYLEAKAQKTSITKEDIAVVDIVIIDPDSFDELGVGYSFKGIPKDAYADYHLPCDANTIEQRCIAQIAFPIDQVTEDTITIDITPTDKKSTGKKKSITFTVTDPPNQEENPPSLVTQ